MGWASGSIILDEVARVVMPKVAKKDRKLLAKNSLIFLQMLTVTRLTKLNKQTFRTSFCGGCRQMNNFTDWSKYDQRSTIQRQTRTCCI